MRFLGLSQVPSKDVFLTLKRENGVLELGKVLEVTTFEKGKTFYEAKTDKGFSFFCEKPGEKEGIILQGDKDHQFRIWKEGLANSSLSQKTRCEYLEPFTLTYEKEGSKLIIHGGVRSGS